LLGSDDKAEKERAEEKEKEKDNEVIEGCDTE
jgi:hypothetical protein